MLIQSYEHGTQEPPQRVTTNPQRFFFFVSSSSGPEEAGFILASSWAAYLPGSPFRVDLDGPLELHAGVGDAGVGQVASAEDRVSKRVVLAASSNAFSYSAESPVRGDRTSHEGAPN